MPRLPGIDSALLDSFRPLLATQPMGNREILKFIRDEVPKIERALQ